MAGAGAGAMVGALRAGEVAIAHPGTGKRVGAKEEPTEPKGRSAKRNSRRVA